MCLLRPEGTPSYGIQVQNPSPLFRGQMAILSARAGGANPHSAATMTNRFKGYGIAALALAVLMTAGAFTMPVKKGGSKTISVVNKCSFSVDRIYISEVDDAKWGDDILGDNEILAPGDAVDIEIDCGTWDVKLVAEDGSTCEVASVEICSADIWEVTADCGK